MAQTFNDNKALPFNKTKGFNAVLDPSAENFAHLQEGVQVSGTDGWHLGAAVPITPRWGQSQLRGHHGADSLLA